MLKLPRFRPAYTFPGIILFLPLLSLGQQYVITTIAGGGLPPTPLPGTSVPFYRPPAAAVDTAGNIYFVAYNSVFKIDVGSGVVIRAAGSSQFRGYGGDGGPATTARLNNPTAVALDSAGNLYIADAGNYRVRKVNSNGIITTVAGNGSRGFSGDSGPATSAQLADVGGIAPDALGNLYIADSGNDRIRKVTPGGVITTVAGTGFSGYSGDGGPAAAAQLFLPSGVATDSAGNLYITDSLNYRIRKVTPNGIISTIAGNGGSSYSGDGGPAVGTAIWSFASVAVDATGNVYIADSSRIRKVSTSGTITTVAGGGYDYITDGIPALTAAISPAGVAVDSGGNLYLPNIPTAGIRKVTPDGLITTVAGNTSYSLWGDGQLAVTATLGFYGDGPKGIALDASGRIDLTAGNRVRRISADGIITVLAGTGVTGYTGDGGPALSAQLRSVRGMALDAAGNFYFSEDTRVRKVSPAGIITTVAGTANPGYSGDGGPATAAKLNAPFGLAFDVSGNLYIADSGNHRVRKVDGNGIISTIAGTGTSGYSGDGGPAGNAQLNYPTGVALDPAGALYIADNYNNRIRKVGGNGVIGTIAGTGTSGYSGDNGPAIAAQLKFPNGVALDAAGNLFIADTGNYRVRKVASNGTITTIAGNGTQGHSGDNGLATNAQLDSPGSLAISPGGDIYVGDAEGSIRLLVPTGTHAILSLAKTHTADFTPGQVGATYSIAVANNSATAATNGTVTVTEIVPAGLNFLNMSGSGWNCPSTTCTRSDTLNPGDAYPPITVTVNVPPDAPAQAINQVTVSGGGSITAGASDAANIPGVTNPALLSPANSTLGMPVSVTLSWAASPGATSYDVYFGTTPSPPLAVNTGATSYAPGTLSSDTTYYWRVVARNGPRSAGSATWTFTTFLTQVRISGRSLPPVPGVLMTLTGSRSGSATTDSDGNFAFSGLPAGGNYTVTPSLTGYTFSPASQTFTNVTLNQTAEFAIVGMQCIANSGVPPTIRAEGVTELIGDVVINCWGGTPTPAGAIIPQMTFTFALNTQVTNRLLIGGPDAVLAIDEPTAAQAKLCVPGVANPGAGTDPNFCPTLGTNGNLNEFKTGNANLFRGSVSGNTVTFTGVPVDPPGLSGTRIFRITNVRADASRIQLGADGLPGQLTSLTAAAGATTLVIANPVQISGFVQSSLTTSVLTADGSALPAPVAFQQCAATAPTKFATLSFTELFPTALKRRTTGGGVTPQNVFGIVYNSESGYYNPGLTTPMDLAGLADFGTRLKAVFNNIPAGVVLYTAVSYPETAPANLFTGSYAVLTATENGTYAPVATTQTLDGRSVAALPVANGSSTAVWEIAGTNMLTSESVSFPLWISYSGPAAGTATVNTGYAPTLPSTGIPRFVDTSTASNLFQITSCGTTTPVTITTSPAGRSVIIDGTPFTAPQTLQWAPGSSHSIGIASPQTGGVAGTRYAFANWSDNGAQGHNIVVPSAAATYTATFNPEYQLSTSVLPRGSGAIAANPNSLDTYYAAGTTVQVTANPADGSTLVNWSGDLTGNANPAPVIMSGPRSVTANFSSTGPAAILSPIAGSTLSGFSTTFTWTAVPNATAYWLDVGTAPGQGNISGGNLGTATSKLITGLPLNGSTVYVSLYTNINGSWQGNYYTYTAATAADPKAAISSPAPGSTLGGASVTFTWTAGTGVSAYWLDVGTAPGQGNIFGGNLGSVTSKLVAGLPLNGSTIYVSLYSNINGIWFGNSYTYTAAANPKAVLTSPTPGSVLPGFSATFTWSPGTGTSAYWLDVGTAPLQGNIFGGNLGTATSRLVTGLPLNGSTVYVSLYSNINGVWQGNSYTFTAATAADPKAAITSPAPGSTLSGPSVTFSWTTGAGVSAYWLDVGTTPGQGNIFGGNLGAATSKLVTGLPMNGAPVYVNLYSNINGSWFGNSYTYTAAQDARAALLTPAPGSTLSGFTVNFTWTAGAGATAYWLDVGTAPLQGNIFGGNLGAATSQQVSGLPTNGSTVYVSLYSFINGAWQGNAYTFTSATGQDPKAAITSPAPGSTLPAGSATFTWSAGTGVSAYWLDVGTAPGQGNISGGNVGTVTSKLVTGLPANGGTVYVNLYSSINGRWYGNSYTYTAASGAAAILTPTPGSTLSGFTATFSWNTAAGATAYWLDVGTAPLQGNIFGGNVGTATSQQVIGLPMNGSTVYVSLYSNINGAWQGRSYTYTAATGQDPKAALLTPLPGTTLSGSSLTFTWTAGTGVSAYWLDVGTAPGQGNISGGNVNTVTSKLVTGLPTNGSTIYVNLYSNIGGKWFGNSYTYTAGP